MELMRYAALPMALFTKSSAFQNPCTGISFVDSTTLDVCDNHRIQQNKVFRGIAMRGKSSAGWFHGFKLHFVINEHGEILTKICLKMQDSKDKRTERNTWSRKRIQTGTQKDISKLCYISSSILILNIIQ